jgi:UDP-glucose 4-epimerase
MKRQLMKIIVVGGNGFIGSHFVARAVDRGHEVIVSGRSERPRFAHGRPYKMITGGLDRLIDNFAEYEDADVICQFASSTIPATSNADPVRDVEENLVQNLRLLDVMRGSRCRRLVYLSSGGAIYGTPREVPIGEDHPQNPISSYGVVKGAVEHYLRLYSANHDLRVSVVRPANPYGPGQDPSGQLGAVPVFLGAALTGRPITLFGDGSIVRDFVYIDDLTDLLTLITEEQAVGVFNCGGGGGGVSLIELTRIIGAVTGRSLSIRHEPERAFDPQAVVLDISRAQRLGWRPSVSLEEGVERTWRAMLAKGAIA